MARPIEARKVVIILYALFIVGTVLSLLIWGHGQELQASPDPCAGCEELLRCEAELDECIAAGKSLDPVAN